MEFEEYLCLFVAAFYVVAHLIKEPCRTSKLTGEQWVQELLTGNARRFREVFRMTKPTYLFIRDLLLEKGLISASRYISVDEKLAIFFIIGHNATNRAAQEISK